VNLSGDFLVVGSGIAGLRAAIALAGVGKVIMLTKAGPFESNTGYAQGGIAASIGKDDSPELHARDTLGAGDGLSDSDAVNTLVTEGPRYVKELLEWGAAFDRDVEGEAALAREAAHSVRRVLHATDATGREIGRVLWTQVSHNPRIQVVDDALVTRLLVQDGQCRGGVYIDKAGREHFVTVTATLLATGGAGQVFRETTNPLIATGDGVAMAFRAGARVTGLEFVQFHPTVLNVPDYPRFLISEALRGEGARLVNASGESFVQRYESAGDLASRDRVARAMSREAERSGASVYLTLAHLDRSFVYRRFPTITKACQQAGLDLATDRIPVSPAAHYLMGGVQTDLHGRTVLPGLYAAGEVACTGVHGANRLASNSLLEGLVFGVRSALAMTQPWQTPSLSGDVYSFEMKHLQAGTLPTEVEVRDMMWRKVGLVRMQSGLRTAVQQLEQWWMRLEQAGTRASSQESMRLLNIVTVGFLIARAALRREESRGGHFREDFPQRDDILWQRNVSDVLIDSQVS
jgi:L-aspartate oxidase